MPEGPKKQQVEKQQEMDTLDQAVEILHRELRKPRGSCVDLIKASKRPELASGVLKLHAEFCENLNRLISLKEAQ